MSVRTHTPAPGYSVRPANLTPQQRVAVLNGDGGRRRGHGRGGEGLGLFVLALALAFVLKTFLVQAFFIPSGSMIPTLAIGDRVLVEKVTFRFREPGRGEVIVFRNPNAPERTGGVGDAVRSFLEGLGLVQPDADIDLIKRVIGLPGDTVEVRDGVVLVNGQPLTEPYADLDDSDFGPLVVPPGQLFMLGDNRGNSEDSRRSLGTVPLDNVVGKAFVILWPPTHADATLDTDYAGVPG
jgi:signal peptidase I